MNSTRTIANSSRRNPPTDQYGFCQDGGATRLVGPFFQRTRRDRSWFRPRDEQMDDTRSSILVKDLHQSLPSRTVLPRTTTVVNLPEPVTTKYFENTKYMTGRNFIAPNSATTLPSVRSISKKKYLEYKVPYILSERRREQCRINQARYRHNQKLRLTRLIEAVDKLEDEIPVLKVKRYRLRSGFKRNIFNVIVDYFHHFQHGILLRKSTSLRRALDPRAHDQIVFLRSVTAPGILLGDKHGIVEHIEQWRRYSSSFDDLAFHLEHMTEMTKNFIVVSASLTVTFVEATLDNVFPHLKGTQVGRKLLGQQLIIPCSIFFEWDEAHNYLVRLELVVDFCSPISRALVSIIDSAFVLGHALLSPSGDIKTSARRL